MTILPCMYMMMHCEAAFFVYDKFNVLRNLSPEFLAVGTIYHVLSIVVPLYHIQIPLIDLSVCSVTIL